MGGGYDASRGLISRDIVKSRLLLQLFMKEKLYFVVSANSGFVVAGDGVNYYFNYQRNVLILIKKGKD